MELKFTNQCLKVISHQVNSLEEQGWDRFWKSHWAMRGSLTVKHLLFINRSMLKCTTTLYLQNDFVVETSLVGTVMNGLSHLRGCTDHGQFIINLLRGLGGNLNMRSRQEFAKEVIFFSKFIKKFSVQLKGIVIFCLLTMKICNNRISML